MNYNQEIQSYTDDELVKAVKSAEDEIEFITNQCYEEYEDVDELYVSFYPCDYVANDIQERVNDMRAELARRSIGRLNCVWCGEFPTYKRKLIDGIYIKCRCGFGWFYEYTKKTEA